VAWKNVEYADFSIRAGAFEVIGTGRFVAAVVIARTGSVPSEGAEKLFGPPSPDGYFESAAEALDAAIAFAYAIIDGELPHYSVADI